ncbi:MAG: hypothetical protein GWN41_01210 [Phycisphaerae bacterium]|nr:hypothetical protein [Phycisphaerae bacterium]
MKCPGCRLEVRKDMTVDVQNLPESLTEGHQRLCTGCLEGMYRKGKELNGKPVTRGALHKALTGEDPPSHPYWDNPARRGLNRKRRK